MDITATNRSQLIEALRETDIYVPPRGPKRSNEHIERWSIARILATLAELGDLDYPIEIVKYERPDYIVKQDRKVTGFEITEAVNPQYIQAKSLLKVNKKDSIVDAGHFKWGVKHKLERLKDISTKKQLTAAPWTGNAVEKEYAQMINDVIKMKTQILNKPGFNKYLENNLIIYINQILPILESNVAVALCSDSLNGYWDATSYENVYVEYDSEIHHYNKSGVKILLLNNLWQ